MKTKAWERGGKWGIKKKKIKEKGQKIQKGVPRCGENDRFILNYKSLAINL